MPRSHPGVNDLRLDVILSSRPRVQEISRLSSRPRRRDSRRSHTADAHTHAHTTGVPDAIADSKYAYCYSTHYFCGACAMHGANAQYDAIAA